MREAVIVDKLTIMESEDNNMTTNEFAKVVTDMIRSEKDIFKELIVNEDWDGLEDEIYEKAELAD